MKIIRYKFNLLELIICLGILAVLASVLLENFADVKARESEARTQERGTHIRSMLTGQNSRDNISDFLSDMGRLPNVYIPAEGDGDGGRRLAELYDPSVWHHSTSGSALRQNLIIPAEDIRNICLDAPGSTFPADASGTALPYPEINMTAGWNGPYINIADPVGGNLYDGWGNAWKIVTDFHYTLSGNQLYPEQKVYAEEADFGGRTCRIDGIISFGANDADDSAESSTAPADADSGFIFAHNMDNYSSGNTAALHLDLKVRDASNGEWRKVPHISFWQSGTVYAKGAVAAAEGDIYCCIRPHTSSSAFADGYWQKISAAAVYDPAVHGPSDYTGLCIYENSYYLRNSSNAETEFTHSNWLRIAGVGEIPDNISLLIFTPVMQKKDGERMIRPGYYHFYRNGSAENTHGVKPLCGASSPAEDIDCTGDTDTVYAAGEGRNERYLIAEDHSPSYWGEFSIRRLIPGRRRIFCIMYSSFTGKCYQSQVEHLPLEAGDNYVTLYLEQKL